MTRKLIVGSGQLGPIQKIDSKASVVLRLQELLKEAKSRKCDLVVFPELALTTFFPRWWLDDLSNADKFYETSLPNKQTQPLFDLAQSLSIGFTLGYAELVEENGVKKRYNSQVCVNKKGEIISKYRKIHLPGHANNQPQRNFQHLERYYFQKGNLGFKAFKGFNSILAMALCNDRRWPETYRCYGLQGAELLMMGYNTPLQYIQKPEHDHLQSLHNSLCMQSGAYQNGMWVVGTAKAGCEENSYLLPQSSIVAPTGEIVALASTMDDELISFSCDLDLTKDIKENVFNFDLYREPEEYKIITNQKGIITSV